MIDKPRTFRGAFLAVTENEKEGRLIVADKFNSHTDEELLEAADFICCAAEIEGWAFVGDALDKRQAERRKTLH